MAAMPYLFLLADFNRQPERLPLNLIIWPIIAVLFGSQWLTAKHEGVFITGQTLGLLVYCNVYPSIDFMMALEPIIDQAALSLVVLILNWSVNFYVRELEEHKKFLEQRQRELEVYTSVLTHDLGNDMQIVRGLVELLHQKLNLPPDQESYLSTSIAVSERMSRVIKLFSVVGRASEYDFLETVQTLADRAKQANSAAKVSIVIEPDIRSADIRPGILLPLVLENLLRNTADYVGASAVVTIRLGLVENRLIITYRPWYRPEHSAKDFPERRYYERRRKGTWSLSF